MLGEERIPRVTSVQYLGLHLDARLRFTSHVDHLKTKLSRYAGITYKIAKYLNLRAAKNFYYSCVYSSLTYCISAATDDIMRLHRRIVKTIFGKFYSGANCFFFKAVKLLKLPDINKLYVAKYMFQFEIMDSCGTVGDTLERIAPRHRYPTRARGSSRLKFVWRA